MPDDIETFKTLLLAREHVIEENEKRLKEKDARLAEKDERITLPEEYVRYMKLKHFGCSSERETGQADLFNETEVIAGSLEEALNESDRDVTENRLTTTGEPQKKMRSPQDA